ncbi:MAG: alpha/beta fold hydrolase, partial [Paracoccaceae bacterium]
MTEPLILIPGLLCDARVMLAQMLAVGADCTVQVTLPTQGQTVEVISQAVLEGAPPRFALMGQGLGGLVALDVIRRAPDRVTRVILSATDPLPEDPKVAADREARMVAARAGRLGEMIAQETTLAAGPDADMVLALQRDMAFELGEGVYMRQSRALQRRPDQQKTLRRAAMPALLFAGAADRVVTPRRMEFMASLMPRAALHVLDNAGSLPTIEAPEAVN